MKEQSVKLVQGHGEISSYQDTPPLPDSKEKVFAEKVSLCLLSMEGNWVAFLNSISAEKGSLLVEDNIQRVVAKCSADVRILVLAKHWSFRVTLPEWLSKPCLNTHWKTWDKPMTPSWPCCLVYIVRTKKQKQN